MLMSKKNSLLKVFCLFLCFLFTPITKATHYAKVVLLGKIGAGKTTLHRILAPGEEFSAVDLLIGIKSGDKTFNTLSSNAGFEKGKIESLIASLPFAYGKDYFSIHTENISMEAKLKNKKPYVKYDINENKEKNENYASFVRNTFLDNLNNESRKNFVIDHGKYEHNRPGRFDYYIFDTSAESRHEKLIDEFCNNANAIILVVKAEDFTSPNSFSGKIVFKGSDDFYRLLRKIPKIAPKSKTIIVLTQIDKIQNNDLKNQIREFIKSIKTNNEFKDYVFDTHEVMINGNEERFEINGRCEGIRQSLYDIFLQGYNKYGDNYFEQSYDKFFARIEETNNGPKLVYLKESEIDIDKHGH